MPGVTIVEAMATAAVMVGVTLELAEKHADLFHGH